MTIRPYEALGTIRKTEKGWSVELDQSVQGLEDRTPVKLLLWDTRSVGARSEYEEIARVQQLELEVVAAALTSEGAMENIASEFLNRLNPPID
jgi:hypothetical protein